MIAATANALREQVQQYNELNRAAGLADSIKQVAAGIAAVRDVLRPWKAGFDACESSLPEQKRAELQRKAQVLGRDLARTQAAFERGEYLQAEALATLQQRAKTLAEETRAAWSGYANDKIAPLARLVDLAAQLPGTEEDLSVIRNVVVYLQATARNLPKSERDVTQFVAGVVGADFQLAGIGRFTDEQRAFLDKLRAGTATVADLTPALLAWCKEKGLAPSLKIRR